MDVAALDACQAHPQIFLREVRDALAEQDIRTSTSGLSRFFALRGITRIAIRHAFTAFSPGECCNYLTAAGYDAYDPT